MAEATAKLQLAPAAMLAWFSGHCAPSVRLEVVMRMLHSLDKMELRFVATCVNQLDERNYNQLRQTDAAANDAEQAAKLLADLDVSNAQSVSLLLVAVASLRASSTAAANVYFSLIWRLDALRPLAASQLDKALADRYLTLLSIGRNHPAFSIGQRLKLTELYRLFAKTHSSEAEDELAEMNALLHCEGPPGRQADKVPASSPDLPPAGDGEASGAATEPVEPADGACVRCGQAHEHVCGDADRSAPFIDYPARVVTEDILGKDESNWQFVCKVEWSDGGFSQVDKSFADVHCLHQTVCCKRLKLPGDTAEHRGLVGLPPRLLASSDVREFFGRRRLSAGKSVSPPTAPDETDSPAGADCSPADGAALPSSALFRLPQRLYEAMRDTSTLKFKPWMQSYSVDQAAQLTLADIVAGTGLAEQSSRELFRAIERLRELNSSVEHESWDSDVRSTTSSRRGMGTPRSSDQQSVRSASHSAAHNRRCGGRVRPVDLNQLRKQQQRVPTGAEEEEPQQDGPGGNWLNSHDDFPTLSETGSSATVPRHRRVSGVRPADRSSGCGGRSSAAPAAFTADARCPPLATRRGRHLGGFGTHLTRAAFKGAMPAGCGVPFGAAGHPILDNMAAVAARLGLQQPHQQLFVLPSYPESSTLQIPHSLAPPHFHTQPQPQAICSCARLGCPACAQLYGTEGVGGALPRHPLVWPDHLRSLSVLQPPCQVPCGGVLPTAEHVGGVKSDAAGQVAERQADRQLMKGGGKLSCCNCGKAGHLGRDCNDDRAND